MEQEQLEKEISYIGIMPEYVLVLQKKVSKKSMIILDPVKDDESKFNYSFEVVKVGDKGVEQGIKVGSKPIFSQWVKFNGFKLLEKTQNSLVSLVIVHMNDFIGWDETPDETPEVDQSGQLKGL